jgi:hypothetical protein
MARDRDTGPEKDATSNTKESCANQTQVDQAQQRETPARPGIHETGEKDLLKAKDY